MTSLQIPLRRTLLSNQQIQLHQIHIVQVCFGLLFYETSIICSIFFSLFSPPAYPTVTAYAVLSLSNPIPSMNSVIFFSTSLRNSSGASSSWRYNSPLILTLLTISNLLNRITSVNLILYWMSSFTELCTYSSALQFAEIIPVTIFTCHWLSPTFLFVLSNFGTIFLIMMKGMIV